MNQESSETLNTENVETEEHQTEENNARVTIPLVDMDQQINITPENDKFIVTLPTENKEESNQWENIIDNFKSRLLLIEKNWLPHTEVNLIAKKNLLDNRQIQTLSDILQEFQLDLSLVVTNRRQTAVAAASAGYSVQQQKIPKPLTTVKEIAKQNLANPLYLQTTIRSGTDICHPGTVIILGDVNPGGSIIAGGDVFIWGTLKGIAHAGAQGDTNRIIMALKMDPTQLRIAHIVARSPDNLPEDFDPEVACVFEEGIKITSAWKFAKTNYLSEKKDNWTKFQNKS